jgi:hypothetical protein
VVSVRCVEGREEVIRRDVNERTGHSDDQRRPAQPRTSAVSGVRCVDMRCHFVENILMAPTVQMMKMD